eukprot:m.1366003 g.1366003  ORF g.1366003 m.1366003 type:complete len:76 (+) comp24950_c1_seq1:107-334(+)
MSVNDGTSVYLSTLVQQGIVQAQSLSLRKPARIVRNVEKDTVLFLCGLAEFMHLCALQPIVLCMNVCMRACVKAP